MTTINIGTKIRELRKKKGITQDMLASVLSISPQAISKWESGLTYPDMAMMPIIAGYFEVSMDMLFDYDLQEMKNKMFLDVSFSCTKCKFLHHRVFFKRGRLF